MSDRLTPEDLEALYNLIDSSSPDVPYAAVSRLRTLGGEVTTALLRAVSSAQNANRRLSRRLDRKAESEQAAVADGTAFTELGLDSVDVANALVACFRELKTYQLTKDKVALVFYLIYSSWLASKRERICIEHPVASPRGPQFWRLYGKVNLSAGDSEFERLRGLNPGLAAMIRNAARKYYDYSVSDLERYIKKSSPYQSCCPKEGEKWNREIPDGDIYNWKKSEITAK